MVNEVVCDKRKSKRLRVKISKLILGPVAVYGAKQIGKKQKLEY